MTLFEFTWKFKKYLRLNINVYVNKNKVEVTKSLRFPGNLHSYNQRYSSFKIISKEAYVVLGTEAKINAFFDEIEKILMDI